MDQCLAQLHNSLLEDRRIRVERSRSESDALQQKQEYHLQKFEGAAAITIKPPADVKEEKDADGDGEMGWRQAAASSQPPFERREAKTPPARKSREEERQEKRALRKKRKKERVEKREKKLRVRPVKDVEKATAWDAVLGHKWEEKHENSFSLLGSLAATSQEQLQQEDQPAPKKLKVVASRYFYKKNKEEMDQLIKVNPKLEQFKHKLLSGQLEAEEAAAGTVESGSIGSDAQPGAALGEDFMRKDDEFEAMLKGWREERADLKKDFKQKKRKFDRNVRMRQNRYK